MAGYSLSKSLHTALVNVIEEVSERVKKGGIDVVGISSGFPALDKATSGFRKKAVYVLSGRPGSGKTSLALCICMNIARQGKKVLFLSLEMDAELLALRVLAMLTGIPSDKIETGRLTLEEVNAVKGVLDVSKNLTFEVIDDTITSTLFADNIAKFQERHGLDFLAVDYLSLFTDPNTFGENERLGRVSKNMLRCAKQCDIPVLALSQLNREVEKRENHVPILSDIRDSGSIEQDAFAVFAVYRPHYYAMMFDGEEPLEIEDAKIVILKQRQGEVGQVGVHFKPKQTLWLPKVIEPKKPRKIGAR